MLCRPSLESRSPWTSLQSPDCSAGSPVAGGGRVTKTAPENSGAVSRGRKGETKRELGKQHEAETAVAVRFYVHCGPFFALKRKKTPGRVA